MPPWSEGWDAWLRRVQIYCKMDKSYLWRLFISGKGSSLDRMSPCTRVGPLPKQGKDVVHPVWMPTFSGCIGFAHSLPKQSADRPLEGRGRGYTWCLVPPEMSLGAERLIPVHHELATRFRANWVTLALVCKMRRCKQQPWDPWNGV